MKIVKHFFVLISCVLLWIGTPDSTAQAQCAMCSLNAENGTKNGNTQGNGLNDGVLFLLGVPLIIVAGVGFLWYKKFRKQNDEKVYF